VEGWFVACPLTPHTMLRVPPQVAYKKIIQTGQLAQKLGAKLLGLGAFTSVVGDGGITIAKQLDIPVTTGDSYTVLVAVEATLKAAQKMEVDLSRAVGAVVGATGAIGQVCAQLLANHVPDLLLIGRRKDALFNVKYLVDQVGAAKTRVSTSIEDLNQADVIITVSSAIDSIIQPHHLKSGAIVCDVARPRDVSRKVVEQRNDVLVIEGGMVEAPGAVNFNFNFGFPPKMVFACMAETIVLALSRRYESFSLGKSLSLEKVIEIDNLAKQHGFRLAGFRSFEKPVTERDIDRIKSNIKAEGLSISER
jgi:predicted amino acid dehydrogenase